MVVGKVTGNMFFSCLCICTLGQVTRVSHLKLVQNPMFEMAMVRERMHSWVRCFEVFDFSKYKQTGRHLREGLFL